MDGMPHDASAPQLRTLLLTDLCDSTGLVERLGDTPAAGIFRDHDRLVLELQQRWRGRLIDRSDGLLLIFERPLDGLGFALDYRRGLDALGQAHRIGPILARAGLHVGEVLIWRNSEEAINAGAKPVEVEGLAKPFAARLMQLARPGQILLSSVAEPLVRRASRELGERGNALQWRTHGRWLFKGVPEVQEIHEVGEPGLAPLRAPRGDAKARRDIPTWRRPVAVVAEVALAVGLVVGGWFVTRPEPAIAFSERDWVVVGDLRNLTGQTVLDDSLEQAFRISLEQSRYVNVLSDLKVRNTLARMERDPEKTEVDRQIGVEVAQRDGARLLILPVVAEVGGRVRISAEVVDPASGRTLAVETADGKGMGSALGSIDAVTASLRGSLGETLASIDRDSAPLPEVTTSNLDALRAYALGQQAFGASRFEEAQAFYSRAVELDPEFALAYIGLLRSYNAQVDLASGLPYLEKAQSLRAHLPPRDQLYLDAWTAEVQAPQDALEKWRQMAMLYPDFFPASANVGYALRMRNAYAEALPYGLRAANAKSEFSGLSWSLVGSLKLATEDPAGAEQAFRSAISEGSRNAKMGLALSYAAQRKFDDALKEWPRDAARQSQHFDLVSIYLDQGRWAESLLEAKVLRDETDKGMMRGRAAFIPLAVAQWAAGNDAEAVKLLQEAIDQSLASVARAGAPYAEGMEDTYVAITAAIIANNFGDDRAVGRVLKAVESDGRFIDKPPVDGLYAALRAQQLINDGEATRAIQLLDTAANGSESFQVRAVLLEAYAKARESSNALEQARWLAQNRGRAYAEQGCGWCQQPFNVYTSTLAHLRAAELLSDLGNEEEAQAELRRLDSAWDSATLPAHLRLRREAVLATFN